MARRRADATMPLRRFCTTMQFGYIYPCMMHALICTGPENFIIDGFVIQSMKEL